MRLLPLIILVFSSQAYAQVFARKTRYADIEALKAETIYIPTFDKPDENFQKMLENSWTATKYEVISPEEFQTLVKDGSKFFLSAVHADYINPNYRGTAQVIALFKGGQKSSYLIDDLIMYLGIDEYWDNFRPTRTPDNMEFGVRSMNLLLTQLTAETFESSKDGTLGAQIQEYSEVMKTKTLYVSYDKTVKWQ